MRSSRPGSQHAFPDTAPPAWMKAVFVVEASIFALAVLLLWEQWDSARAELTNMNKQLKAKSDERDTMRREQENTLAYLSKFENDPEFKKREARQRLGLAEPGEVVFRLATPESDSGTPRQGR